MNYSILFIGNSYTYYNDMPTAIFEKMAEAAGLAAAECAKHSLCPKELNGAIIRTFMESRGYNL